MTGTLISKLLPSGKEYYYIRLSYKAGGKWKSKTLSTGLETKNNKRKAEALITEYVEKYSVLEESSIAISINATGEILLADYLRQWIADKKPDLRASTYEAYSYRIDRLIQIFEREGTRLIDVTPGAMDRFIKNMRMFGKINQKTHEPEPLAVRSVREYRNLLFSVFNQALVDGLIRTNPIANVKVGGKKDRDYSEGMLFLTEEEISDMLHFLAEHEPWLVGIAFFGAYYGLRRSEILGLKWSAVDFTRKNITICHTVTRVRTLHEEGQTKTAAGSRTLQLTDTAVKCLQSIKEQQEKDQRFFGNVYKNHKGYVFVQEDGTSYDPDFVSSKFTKMMKKFGRPEITLHKLRHTCASLLIAKGWDVKKVQYWLGHSDPSTTLRIYAHFNKMRLNETEADLADISKAAEDLFPVATEADAMKKNNSPDFV